MSDEMVRVDDVHKAFGSLEVLKGVDLLVESGEVCCVLGPSGSGKSTLLRCVNHLEKIDAGRIFVDGDLIGYRERGGKLHELREKDVAAQRQAIGMVFQRFNLFPHMTVLSNVMEGPCRVKRENKGEVRDRARALLDRVGLADKMDVYPAQLSGGQQQRVAIARALAMDGMTMVVVTHEIGFAREVGDSLIFMDGGVVVEKGAPRDVIANPQQERTKAFLSKVL